MFLNPLEKERANSIVLLNALGVKAGWRGWVVGWGLGFAVVALEYARFGLNG